MVRLVRIVLIAPVGILLAAALLLAGPPNAGAYDEPNGATERHSAGGYDVGCTPCHRAGEGSPVNGCRLCHPIHGPILDPTSGKGPHGLYSRTTDRCSACHTVHDAGGGKLLSRATVAASCFVCHDGTGGRGVYGAVFARTGNEPGGAHRIETATIVPGGNASNGDTATMPFRGPGGTLTCGDCHSPHDSDTVNAYRIERWRSSWSNLGGGIPGLTFREYSTTHLLRRSPGDAAVDVAEYGSDWCLACHAGRLSGGVVHNHPVGSSSTEASPSTYSKLAVLASDFLTSLTVTGTLAGTNRGYLMPFPRTAQQSGHRPICQQCHEDTRDVGTLSEDGASGDAATFTIDAPDGNTSSNNPRFQNFPHETVESTMLVEIGDNLCANCHPLSQLP